MDVVRRERDVLRLLARGYAYKEIASELFVSVNTVKTHLKAIYRKLDESVVREAPIVPLFHERLFVLHKPDVRGVRTSLVPPPVRYHDIWVEAEE